MEKVLSRYFSEIECPWVEGRYLDAKNSELGVKNSGYADDSAGGVFKQRDKLPGDAHVRQGTWFGHNGIPSAGCIRKDVRETEKRIAAIKPLQISDISAKLSTFDAVTLIFLHFVSFLS
jgi:hypothetical protein